MTSGSTTTDLLLGITGRNRLLAAGDKLRELIIPDALAQTLSSVTLGGGPAKKQDDKYSEGKADAARDELDSLVASVCPLCESAIVGLDKPFIADGEDTREWDV